MGVIHREKGMAYATKGKKGRKKRARERRTEKKETHMKRQIHKRIRSSLLDIMHFNQFVHLLIIISTDSLYIGLQELHPNTQPSTQAVRGGSEITLSGIWAAMKTGIVIHDCKQD